jgi:prepilin-type processing-associated H-X9-DG protein
LAITFVEEAQFSIDDGQYGFIPSGLPGAAAQNEWYNIPAILHNGSNFAFADGHAEFRFWIDKTTRGATNNNFVDPGPFWRDLRWIQNGIATR